MAGTELESRLDEQERDNLQKVISQVETALAVSTPGARGVLERALDGARSRVGVLDQKIKDAQTERETRARDQAAAIAQMAERESRLNAQEKETFSGFLKKDFFTKADFGALEKFYTQTWDRLSEKGKDAMSHRIWEGIRRDEFAFGDLPDPIREKESGHTYKRLRDSAIGNSDLRRIPASDREDFIRAYESGKREEAERVLERPSFRENMFRGAESKSINHERAVAGREDQANAVGKAIADTRPNTPPRSDEKSSEGKSGNELSDLNLDGLALVEATEVSVNAMPGKATGNRSLGG